MKRQVIIFLTIPLLAVLFSSCGSNNVDEIATGGVLPDKTSPFVLATSPTGTNVPTNTSITVTFSEPVANINSFTFTVVSGAGFPVTGSFSIVGSTVTFTPSTVLGFNQTYTINITTAVTDFAGNPLLSAVNWSFTTGAQADTTPPTVLTNTPTGTNVPANTVVTVTFSEQVNCLTITGTSFNLTYSGGNVAGTAACTTGWDATFTPSSPLLNNTVYTATLVNTVTDLAGNKLATNKVWTFTTVPSDSITTASLPSATEGGAYSQTMTATGGTLPLSWTATGLPSGLSINISSGVISGTLAAGTAASSPYSVSVTATDAVGVSANKILSLTVNPTPTVTSPTAASVYSVTENQFFTLSVTASGGTGALTWGATGKPAGLNFNPTTGLSSSLTGTVAAGAAGVSGITSYPVGLTVQDSNLVSSPTTTITIYVLSTVTGVSAAPNVTPGDIDVSWTDTSAASYTVYYSTTSPVTTSDSSVTSASSPVTVTGLTSGTPYFFAVSAVYSTVDGPFSSSLSSQATTTAP